MRHRRMLAPIVSIKHYVNIEKQTPAAGTSLSIQIVQAVVQTAVSNFSDVVEGSLVKAVYVELWLKSNSAAGTEVKFQLVVEKVTSNQEPISFTQMNNLMTYPNKKNVLFVSQGVLGDLTTQSIPIVRNWFKIPKGKQRFGLDDEFFATVSATNATYDVCGLAVFKEYK